MQNSKENNESVRENRSENIDYKFKKEEIDKSIEEYEKYRQKNGIYPQRNSVDCTNDNCNKTTDTVKECITGKNMGKIANAGMTKDDSRTATRLLQKNWSPLIVRKYQMEGWSLFVAIICDANLNDLDEVVYDISARARELGFMNGNIQDIRNYCGFLNDEIVKHYNSIKRGCTEGVMVCWYVDKMWVSSAYGDLMQHEKCVNEVYSIINTLPHV